jgi:hypothetical protein
MADHDLMAELQGYKNELANADDAGNSERAGAVRDEISRVEGLVRDRAEGLEKQAEEHAAAGQDVRAAEAVVAARRYRRVLDDTSVPADAPKRRPGRPGKENTKDATPKETT